MAIPNHNVSQTAKSRSRVKPILKKFAQSENNSLDLHRSTTVEEDGVDTYDYSRTSHDVIHQPTRRGFHARSASGTSQYSAGSSNRAASFVHPFIQRPCTPPAVTPYLNSFQSERSDSAAEDEGATRPNFCAHSSLSTRTPSFTTTGPQTTQPLLRIQTKQQPSLSSYALATSNVSVKNLNYLSPLSPDITSPSDSMTSASVLRSSFDNGFRTRSYSNEVHSRQRSNTETIAEARRKFDEREALKDEKAAREEVRKRERETQRQAKKIERGHRRSSASDATRAPRSKSDLTMQSYSEKSGSFAGADNSSVQHTDPEETEEQHPTRSYTATSAVKMKTHGTWTKFMMWLHTRFLRLGNRKSKYT
ncbi:hypothetical protein BJ878DRAFT_479178 [Calycina marina]|uniref:Uncharacterized protein n=1 Tax=Calycina marina TaxID=1763456 RepID=A0A9P7Z587_9HELO|nr:hypothetical protein BJ878DRAFT_479178 [Calycina marina]